MQQDNIMLIENDILGLYQELVDRVIDNLETLKISDRKNQTFNGTDFIKYDNYGFDAEEDKTEILIFSIIKNQFIDEINELSMPIIKMMWLYNCVEDNITEEKVYSELANDKNLKEQVVEKLCYMLSKKVDFNKQVKINCEANPDLPAEIVRDLLIAKEQSSEPFNF